MIAVDRDSDDIAVRIKGEAGLRENARSYILDMGK